jgi:hypothetical protein
LSKTRGLRNLLSRIGTVYSRFGFSSKKFQRILKKYCSLTQELGCKPTFSLTAVILKRHPELIREIRKYEVEFAIHGYIHTDHGVMSYQEQKKHFSKAIDVFNRFEIPFTGFRAPFLRVNDHTFQAITDLGFPYDSSNSVNWEVIDRAEFTKEALREYQRVLDYYSCPMAKKTLALPRMINNFIEIPVSMPDDEIMMERLGLTDHEEMTKIWSAVLKDSYASGELFTIQLHPERISYYEKTLTSIINDSKKYSPPVWLATLGDISNWWRERGDFQFKIESDGNGKYKIKADCSERATILVKNVGVNVPVKEWCGDYQTVNSRDFVLESARRPVIGVKPDSSPEAVQLLRNEGYIVELGERADDYAIYLDDLKYFKKNDEKALSDKIEQSDAPLLRYWRWPVQARSAVSVTGDIDSITLTDFILRIFETLFTPKEPRKEN